MSQSTADGRLSVRTDHKWKMVKTVYEVPLRVLKSQFDWMFPKDVPMDQVFDRNDCEYYDGFFKYENYWYNIADFESLDRDNPLAKLGWSGVHHDSYSSGVVIKLKDDGEEYMVGVYVV